MIKHDSNLTALKEYFNLNSNLAIIKSAAQKSTYPIRNVQLSDADRNNISPLQIAV